MQDFEKKATALQYKIPELVSGGNVTDCKRTMQKIRKYDKNNHVFNKLYLPLFEKYIIDNFKTTCIK